MLTVMRDIGIAIETPLNWTFDGCALQDIVFQFGHWNIVHFNKMKIAWFSKYVKKLFEISRNNVSRFI